MVLANILRELKTQDSFNVSILTSKTQGCLSGIEGIIYYNNFYNWSENKLVLLLRFIISQIYTFLFVLIKAGQFEIIYINTVLPFSAAFAARIRKKKIIYHVHEVYIHPNILQRIMYFIMENNADKIIAVSKYVSEHINRESVVIYNTVSRDFCLAAKNIIMGGGGYNKHNHP